MKWQIFANIIVVVGALKFFVKFMRKYFAATMPVWPAILMFIVFLAGCIWAFKQLRASSKRQELQRQQED